MHDLNPCNKLNLFFVLVFPHRDSPSFSRITEVPVIGPNLSNVALKVSSVVYISKSQYKIVVCVENVIVDVDFSVNFVESLTDFFI